MTRERFGPYLGPDFEATLEVARIYPDSEEVLMVDSASGVRHRMALAEVADIARSGRAVGGQITGRFRFIRAVPPVADPEYGRLSLIELV